MTTERAIIQSIVKRNGAIVKYDRRRIGHAILKATASVGNANPALAETMSQKVEEALAKTYGSGIPTVEDIQDVVESVLMENRLTRIAHNYIIYRHQRAMARAARAHSFEVTDNVPYRIIYDVLRWNMDHQCESVEALNHIIRKGQFPALVRAADQRYDAEVTAAADRILGNLEKIRIVIIAGPSSSGKTTTTIKIGEQLKKAGISLKALTVDNYFFDLDQHPTDEFGDHDYETPQALDMALINEHLVQLLDGRTIQTPQYSFKEGIRRLNVHEMSLAPNEILLIDSLHGLHESMTSRVGADRKFKLYVETLGQFRMADGTFMRWSDNRLLRRMIRDKDHRNLKPMETLTHWHYVRRSELKSIIPFLKSTDCIVNTALPYELPILRDRLFRCISKGTRMFKSDPRRLDAHIRANRVYELLKPLKVVKDDSCVPDNSLLREFIGGSRYKY